MPAERTQAVHALTPMRGVLFDLDGVLTPTLEVHKRAWAMVLAPYLEARGALPYSDDDYFVHVDGRPRVDGIRAVLASRGLALEAGAPADPPDADTLWGLGNRKNGAFWRALEETGIAAYPGSVRFLDAALEAGYRAGVVSSSRNATAVLAAAGLRDRFDVVVDGLVAGSRGLAGKPDPATYLEGARLLDVRPEECVVVEDAVSGVEAGRRGGFGAVVGIDRGVGAQALLDAGASLVVEDLGELTGAVSEHRHVREGER